VFVLRIIEMIQCELDIVLLEVDHPEIIPVDHLDFAPRAQWNGSLAQLLELIVALSLSGLLRKLDGVPMNLAEVASLFEEFFGVKISDLYGRKTKLLTRKKNESPFLENLLHLYRQEVEKASL
jgi:hypothetical protein